MTVPWRFLVPRAGYFRSLKIARECPEISGHVDRMALYTAGGAVISVPLVVGVIVVYPVFWAAEKSRGLLGLLPDFSARRLATLSEAHRIVPVEEIRRRIGLPQLYGTIRAKPASNADDNPDKGDIHCAVNMADPANMAAARSD